MPNFVRDFNWVDLFIIILSFRICYMAFVKGLAPEIFKLLGTVCALYLSMHFYASWGQVASERMGLQSLPLGYVEFVCFAFLAFLGYMVFVFARYAAGKLLQTETMHMLDKWGGLTLGIGRAILLVAMLVFMFVVSGSEYMKTCVEKSLVGKQVFYYAPSIYAGMWDGLFSKISPREEFNKKVDLVKQSLAQ